jgi:uncharacterized protein (DUF736 family)
MAIDRPQAIDAAPLGAGAQRRMALRPRGTDLGAADEDPVAWRSSEGRDYLSVKLDDPSFTTPIYANLFDDEGGETFSLIWSRGRRSNGD